MLLLPSRALRRRYGDAFTHPLHPSLHPAGGHTAHPLPSSLLPSPQVPRGGGHFGRAGPEDPGRRGREVGTWPPQRSPRMAAALGSGRLEVSVDGLTLSPNSEAPPPPCEARPGPGEPGAGRSRAAAGPGCAEAGGEEAALSPERRWGFALEELYGLALRFFKGTDGRGAPRPLPAGTGWLLSGCLCSKPGAEMRLCSSKWLVSEQSSCGFVLSFGLMFCRNRYR